MPATTYIVSADGTIFRPSGAALFGDGTANPTASGFQAFSMLWNGATWDRQRTPNIFKSVGTANSGSSALWTPTAGKRFRLMRCLIGITGNAVAAAAALNTVALLDAAAAIGVQLPIFVNNAAINTMGPLDTGWIDFGNGYLSTTINNVLNLNLSVALTAGQIYAIAVGTEE